jgi:hypothetical protein
LLSADCCLTDVAATPVIPSDCYYANDYASDGRSRTPSSGQRPAGDDVLNAADRLQPKVVVSEKRQRVYRILCLFQENSPWKFKAVLQARQQAMFSVLSSSAQAQLQTIAIEMTAISGLSASEWRPVVQPISASKISTASRQQRVPR